MKVTMRVMEKETTIQQAFLQFLEYQNKIMRTFGPFPVAFDATTRQTRYESSSLLCKTFLTQPLFQGHEGILIDQDGCRPCMCLSFWCPPCDFQYPRR